VIEISMVMLVKNESHCIADAIKSARPYVNEILVINDHSTDDTEAAAIFAGASRVVVPPFKVEDVGFSHAWNWMIDNAAHDWVLIMDADERLGPDGANLQVLTRYPGKTVWNLPRHKWEKYPLSRTEFDAYPDWQTRFMKRRPEDRFSGELHVTYHCPRIWNAYRGPHIEHLQDEFRTPEKKAQRMATYTKLADIQGVNVYGGDVKVINET
jgi:glycosyltransferase involved in cell wall biosynthesis